MKKIINAINNPITYFILLDILAIILFIFFAFIFGEIILSGILSNYISLGKLTGIVFVVIGIITILAREQEVSFENKKINKNLIIFVCATVALLTFVSVFKFGIITGSILTVISLVLFILIHKYFFEELEENKKMPRL